MLHVSEYICFRGEHCRLTPRASLIGFRLAWVPDYLSFWLLYAYGWLINVMEEWQLLFG